MNDQSVLDILHPLEIKLLNTFAPGEEISFPVVAEKLNYKEGQFNQAVNWLASKELLEECARETVIYYELTELGRESLEKGSFEERLITWVKEKGETPINDLAGNVGIEMGAIGSIFGQLSKLEILSMDKEKKVSLADSAKGDEVIAARKEVFNLFASHARISSRELTGEQKEKLEELLARKGKFFKLFRASERTEITYTFTSLGGQVKEDVKSRGMTGEEVGILTPAIITSGEWKEKGFRRYNLNIPPTRVLAGRKNAYMEVVNAFKDKCVALGFEEMSGPLIEAEFWNCDALYMPQFHPARDIHDAYYTKNQKSARGIDDTYMNQVAAAHENGGKTGSLGWGYAFDRDKSRRLMLRSQGTAVSARQLTNLKVPGKYFSVARCFRYDKVDATHLPDFYQAEGIAVGHDVNLKTLLGLLEIVAREVGKAEDIKFVPGYFPFTEPSVEMFIKHPVIGWFELGGSGVFRPEVVKSFNVDAPVLAWGLGLDRMAMMSLGVNDIRDLFSSNIDKARSTK